MSAAGRQEARGAADAALGAAELVVDGDAQGLEGPRGGMDPAVPVGGRHGVPDELGEGARRARPPPFRLASTIALAMRRDILSSPYS